MKRFFQYLVQEIPVPERGQRMLDLDAARGVGIILVVIGHIIGKGFIPKGNDWFEELMDMIYQFHMPFFMVLCGITFTLSLPLFASWGGVFMYSFRRIKPLMVSWAALGLIVLIGKKLAAEFVRVGNPPGDFWSSAGMLVLYPKENAVRFLWFIYVLSIYLLLVPVLFHKFGRRPILLLIAAVILACFNWPAMFGLNECVQYLPFFVLGIVMWVHRPLWNPVGPWLFWPSVVVFIALLAYSNLEPIPRWVTGVLSVLPLLGLAQRMPMKVKLILCYVGQRSLCIYLFNVLVIGLVRSVGLLVLPWDGIFFLVYFPVLTVAGVTVPLVIKAVCQRWLPPVAKYM